ncbi:MAG: AbrB family transcriptional regulator [Deltaproteobacteria bacterium 21-66-5]|nr:MAG: AbrB family transcriptional regulator [Deltaproteobacteria bacterium 21-66-5]
MREHIVTSKMTSKHQATIPAPVRKALGLKAGDAVAFEIEPGNAVRLRKAGPLDMNHLRAVEGSLASEWLSHSDEEAYRGL